MVVTLTDGRIIMVPVSAFPSIKKLSLQQRKKWYLFGNGFSFDNCDRVFYIEQIIGNFDSSRHENINQWSAATINYHRPQTSLSPLSPNKSLLF